MSEVVGQTRRQVEAWARQLIDLSRRNTTLYYKPTKRSSLEIAAPEFEDVVELIAKPAPVPFFLPPASDELSAAEAQNTAEGGWSLEDCTRLATEGQLVTDRLKGREVTATLQNLARRAQTDYLDRGVQSLYVCFGMLHWREAEGDWNRSPLVFVPVALDRTSPREPYRLERVGEEALLNPALAVLLGEQFDVSLPTSDVDLDDTSAVEKAFTEVTDAVADHSGWWVERKAVLKRATFHKEAMYRDLLEHAEEIAAHEVVQSLAVAGAGAALAEEVAIPDEDGVDDAAPPEQASLILDADSSQRRAIAAAKAGASVVMDGPPGTGKSQTIANLIAELLADGKRVLFVSEKSAALQVVANRLESCGLGDFLFGLYDHRTSRKDAAVELGRALRSRPQVRPGARDVDTARARSLRERLSSYADAINREREPLGRSVHWVLGRLSQLHSAARLPSWSTPPGISAAEVEELKESFDRLARRWRPAVEPQALLWQGVADGPDSAERLGRVAGDFAEALEQVSRLVDDLATACGLDMPENLEQARRLCEAAEHTVEQPGTLAAWWSHADLAALTQRVSELERLKERHAEVVAPLKERFADAGAGLDAAASGELASAVADLTGGQLFAAAEESLTREELRQLGGDAFKLTELVDRTRQEGFATAEALGAARKDRTLAQLRAVADVAVDADASQRPQASWATPATANQVRHAIDRLRPLQEAYERQGRELAEVFEPGVLELDLPGLCQRFANVHLGWRKLSGAYRADKRAVAAVAHTRRASEEVIAKLDAAREWQDSAQSLDAAEEETAAVLGGYAAPRSCRLDAAEQALERVVRARARLGEDFDDEGVGRQLGGAKPADPQLGTRASRLLTLLAEVSSRAQALSPSDVELEEWTLGDVELAAGRLIDASSRADAVLAAVNRQRHSPATVAEARTDLELRGSLDGVEHKLAGWQEPLERAFAEFYDGLETDTDALSAGLSWTVELQRRYGGPLPVRAVQSLHGHGPALPTHPLREALEQAVELRARLLGAFHERRRSELDTDFAGDLEDARRLAVDLARRVSEVEEWRAFEAAHAALRAHGWSEQLDDAARQRIPGEALSEALDRALWVGWIEAISADEPVLQEARGDDLDAWVAEFRELDPKLLSAAAERVVERCTAARPRSAHGAASTIEREANKKRRHMPVRDLLQATGEVAQALKPCFMMSPLTVSQFLPSSLTFDVVIFDEASQVTPADAVNCIYRGRQLVVTGDDKQLPPTNFFDLAAFDDDSDEYDDEQLDEFESIITQAKSSAGMPSLPLRWHYRSQHEDLITFSNYRYYAPDAQRLHTFPGARTNGDDLGVSLYEVDGVYRRGGPRDNPTEADAVAKRVLTHAERILALPEEHRETVGVVAFSVAQADAIEQRIEQIRLDRPELEAFFASERLDGFFVKNLESVQGDERDIMIFSIGYGPDETGKFTTNFGPLSGKHGHRRLNVAITRARRRVEVVCSFTPSRINAGQATHRGVPDLKRYLEYAQQGPEVLGLDLTGSLGDVESPFEASVLEVIRGWGFDVVPQVGTAGYRIDLGVRDPADPDRYVLGVECDGRAYHSSRVARDRDRLRAEVLTGLGWRLHRIWGPSWYRDRDAAEATLRAAIDESVNGGAPAAVRRDHAPVVREVEQLAADELVAPPGWTVPYKVRRLPRVHAGHPGDPGAFAEVANLVRRILEVEAPIHVEPLARRIAAAYDCNLTSRVRRAVDDAVLTLSRQGRCQREGAWVRRRGSEKAAVVRVAGEDPDSVRSVKHVPPEERAQAMLRFTADAHLIDEEELLTLVARLFDVARTSQPIRDLLADDLDRLLAEGRLERNGDEMIRPGPDTAN